MHIPEANAYMYVLISLKDGSTYVGSTHNLTRRLKEHNAGKMRYTKGHLPYKLVYFETYDTYSEAFRREKYLKSGAGREWLKENVLKEIDKSGLSSG
ncbi:MAG TPA: GIY-YIG nuclease family protein [Caldithrix abyssi]|uniref:GIY-YIG nuclease family protein n=1 Tax=Caldithrix abyssi TaxID=187145 RepID=A0A7V4WTC6_CALAY|nr:GIY-YIG nuclease family protein [Caldithrix abyssi]